MKIKISITDDDGNELDQAFFVNAPYDPLVVIKDLLNVGSICNNVIGGLVTLIGRNFRNWE